MANGIQVFLRRRFKVSARASHGERGVTLLATLVMMTVLASFAMLLQQRMVGQVAVTSMVIQGFEDDRAESSVLALFRPSLAESFQASSERADAWLPLNSEAVVVSLADQQWIVEAQDTASLPSRFSTQRSVFRLLFPDRDIRGLAEMPNKFIVERPSDGRVNQRHLPTALAPNMQGLHRSALTDKPAETVRITLHEIM